MPTNKKYTLFSSSTMAKKGGKPPCAFFASPDGCRNGDNCKFSHEKPSAAPDGADGGADASPQQRPRSTSSGSVVSSESSDGNSAAAAAATAAEKKKKKKSAKKKKETDDSPFVTASEHSAATNNTDNDDDNAAASGESTKKKKKTSKNRRGKRSTDEDDLPFASPKNAKKSKTVSSSTTPSSSSSSAVAATNLPPSSTSGSAGKAKTATTPTTTYTQMADAAVTSPRTLPQAKKERKVLVSSRHVTDFRLLNLPVAPFPGQSSASANAVDVTTQAKESLTTPKGTSKEETKQKKQQPKNADVSSPSLPLPTSTPTAQKWLEMIEKTREHPRYPLCYDFDKLHKQDRFVGGKTAWVKSRPAGAWCKDAPAAIGIDCEMCETADPVSGEHNTRELCRISVINAEDDSVLLDTLVKPSWPVVDYRTWINGIEAHHLESVQFTIRHAQAFMMALCSEETIIIGHAVQNDLAAVRMEHHCVVDSALLYKSAFAPTATVSLRDTAAAVLQKEMPKTHDSVNDARTALAVLEYYREKKGQVEPIPRRMAIASSPSPAGHTSRFNEKLFIHRIPKKTCTEKHLSQLFLKHCAVEPDEVDPIEFAGEMGKTYVTFRSARHAELAFDFLDGKAEPDATKRLQKKVFLRNGSYIRVRKMAFEKDE